MKKLITTIALFAVAIFAAHAQAPAESEDVMLQAFYWNSHSATKWSVLATQAEEIGSTFTLIWLPPASAGEGGGSSNMGYHPYKYSSLSSSWGSKNQLTSLIKLFQRQGAKVIADIVINHHAGKNACCSYETENFGTYGRYTFDRTCVTSDDEMGGGGAKDKGYEDVCGSSGGYCDARDMDHSNTAIVQPAFKAYLQWLKNDIGFDGWRYDLVKGYLGKYTKMYNEAAKGYMSVGEFYDSNYDKLTKWIDDTGKTSTAFDFAFKDAVTRWGGGSNYSQLVWKDGTTSRPAGLCHSPSYRRYAVTFIDNHDTDVSHEGGNWPYSGDVEKANAFMLSSPGIPCVFWKHWVSKKDAIKKMIAARKAAGIHSESDVVVNNTNGYYQATATGKKGKLICFIGSGWSAPSGYTLACQGNGWAYYTNVTVSGPVVTMNPTGGYVGQGGKVTLTTTAGTIYYTTDGSVPSASSTPYTGPISITQNNTTIKAIAINGTEKSDVVSGTFLTEQPQGLTVQFLAPSTWSSVALYVWDKNNNEVLGEWPGKQISKSGDYYTYTITESSERPLKFIFNDNGNGHQTTDLSASSNTCWDGSDGGDKPEFTPPTCGGGPVIPTIIQIGVKKSGNYATTAPNIYYWNNGAAATWPGNQMQSLDTKWWYYNVPTTTNTVNVVFNAGGDATKTQNLEGITSQSCYEITGNVATPVSCTGLVDVEESDADSKDAVIYPNPTTGELNISSNVEYVNARITNLAGQTFIFSVDNSKIDVSSLSDGLYIIDLISADGTTEKAKFIKK